MQTATEVTVGDITYTITTFPALKGLTYLQKLMKIFGPAIGQIISQASEEATEVEVEEEALSKAIALMSENLDKDDVATLVKTMVVEAVTISGQPVPFDQQFSANYGALIKVITAILKENYSSFFGESGFGNLSGLLPLPQQND